MIFFNVVMPVFWLITAVWSFSTWWPAFKAKKYPQNRSRLIIGIGCVMLAVSHAVNIVLMLN